MENVAYTHAASTGALPQIYCRESSELIPAHAMIEWLAKKVGDLDVDLDAAAKARSLSLRAIINGVLEEALIYSRWHDNEHFHAVVLPQMRRALPFPLSWMWPRTLRKYKLLQFSIAGTSMEKLEYRVKQAYEALAGQLENGDWIMGTERPTTADAVLFGHLAHAICEPIAKYIPRVLLKYHRRVHVRFLQMLLVEYHLMHPTLLQRLQSCNRAQQWRLCTCHHLRSAKLGL